MQRTRPPHTVIAFTLLIAAWFAAASAAAIEPGDQRSVAAERILSSCSGRACRPIVSDNAPGKPGRYTKSRNSLAFLSVGGQALDMPSCRLEKRFFTDAADGRLDALTPLESALVASGVEDVEDLDRYRRKAAALAEELRRSEILTDEPRQRVEAIFEFMHARILRGGYDLAYTDLRRVLDGGRFNCVSATVLFNYLAGELGVDSRGLEMPGHAMSRISFPEGTVDVENTCPRWFHLDGDPERRTECVNHYDHSKAREVSPIQLAAMIYYNRGVDFLGEKQFAKAAGVNAKAMLLDPQNATARGNLLATLNNWAIELGNRRQFAEAIELLQQGLAMDATFSAFAQNYVHVHHQWIEHLCREGRFEEATEILSLAAAEMPDRDYLREAQSAIRRRWAKAIADAPAGEPSP